MATNPYEALKDAAAALIKDGADASTLLSAATLLKNAVESEKVIVETHNIKRSVSTEAFRFYVPVIAPLVSALAVVGALVFQTIQFQETGRLQAQTVEIQKQTVELQAKSAEDTAWREAIKTLTQSPTIINGIAGATLLSAFLTSGSHVEEARNLAFSVLGGMQFESLFKSLFLNALQATPQSKRLVNMADLSSRLRETYFRLDLAANGMRPKPSPDLPTIVDQRGKEFQNPLFARNQVDLELTIVCENVASTLKSAKGIPSASDTLDFTLWNCDLAGVDLSTLGLIRANIQKVSLVDTDLRNVKEYSNSNWSNTAWWRAKGIEKGLLKYLTEKFPFSPQGSYFQEESKTDYETNLARVASEN